MAEKPLLKEPSPLLDKAEKAFEKHKKMRRFFECVENGSKEDLKEIEEILIPLQKDFFTRLQNGH